jgi:peptidoglycan hydrolase-like protein with peptidoglycan-binding domain
MAARTLFLTTPMMVGDDVRRLQKALKNPGRADLKDEDFLESDVDGQFGEDTHRAVYRAKYWLGFRNPDYRAGDKLVGFLNGVKPPTAQMKDLRKKRLTKQKAEAPGLRKLREAVKHLGLKENPPQSNKILFASWYDVAGPWCAMFVAYCGAKAGLKSYAKRPPGRWAYVPFMLDDAKAGRNHYSITHHPVTGDDAAYDFPPKTGTAEHVGIFATEEDLKKVAPDALRNAKQSFGALRSGEFWAVEGNTMVGSDSNGGEVMLRKRRKADVLAFMHPGD